MLSSVNLGRRLQTVAEMVPDQARLGDIGTDHAYLPIWLYEQGKIKSAVGIDVHQGPYQSAREAVLNRNLTKQIEVRFGDGLNPLKPGEIDTLTLAGMGGKTMLSILWERPDVLVRVSDLILQPQGAERQVRIELLEAGWLLKNECLVEEEGRIYVVMAYSRNTGKDLAELKQYEATWIERLSQEPGEEPEPLKTMGSLIVSSSDITWVISKLFWQIGPLVLEEPNQELVSLISDQVNKLEKQLEQMKLARDEAVLAKMEQVRLDKMMLEGIKQWLLRLM